MRQLLTTTQQQFCLISPASLIWVVKVQQLEAVYFTFPPSPKKVIFFSLSLSHTMTNPEAKGGGRGMQPVARS